VAKRVKQSLGMAGTKRCVNSTNSERTNYPATPHKVWP